MKSIIFVLICALTMPDGSFSEDACYDNPSAGEANPLEKYMKNTNLVTKFLKKFPPASPLSVFDRYYQTLLEESNSDVVTNNIVSWELTYFATAFIGKAPKYICSFYTVPIVAVDFENTGNITSLKCLVEMMKANSEIGIYNLIEKVFNLDECEEYYKPHVTRIPECVDSKCLKEQDPKKWEKLYTIIKSYAQEYKVPLNDQYHAVISEMLTSLQTDQWVTGFSTLGVWLHTMYLSKKGIASDPVVLNVVLKMVNLMEQLIHAKFCSCEERVSTLTTAANELTTALNNDMDLLFSKFQ